MKKIIFTLLAATATVSATMAMNPKNVLTDKLPKEARHLIHSNYRQQAVAKLTTDWDTTSTHYKAELGNGTVMYFDGYGQWNAIDNPNESLPKGIVPRRISRYVKKNFPGSDIVAAAHSQTDNSYGVILDNDLELVFDGKGHYTGW